MSVMKVINVKKGYFVIKVIGCETYKLDGRFTSKRSDALQEGKEWPLGKYR